MLEDLHTLCLWDGNPGADVFFPFYLGGAMDVEQMERTRLRRHMFLARFARQSVLQWRDVDSREVRRYADMLAEFLAEEHVSTEDQTG